STWGSEGPPSGARGGSSGPPWLPARRSATRAAAALPSLALRPSTGRGLGRGRHQRLDPIGLGRVAGAAEVLGGLGELQRGLETARGELPLLELLHHPGGRDGLAMLVPDPQGARRVPGPRHPRRLLEERLLLGDGGV